MSAEGTIRLGLLFALTVLLSGCSLISITHCAMWNLLPAFGIAYTSPVCPGGQQAVTTKPPPLPTVQEMRP